MLLHHVELRNELRGKLNNGKPGWNYDEPAVVELVCQRVLRLFFGKEYDAHDIAEFLNFVELSAAGDPPIDRLKTEMLIREAIEEPGVEVKDIRLAHKFVLEGLMAALAAFQLELSESTVDGIITDSERLAFERGWKPPLIRDKRRAADRM
jgi:hypothetical protein